MNGQNSVNLEDGGRKLEIHIDAKISALTLIRPMVSTIQPGESLGKRRLTLERGRKRSENMRKDSIKKFFFFFKKNG
jgi:hypothetical protein